MNNKNIRWKQRFENYEKSYNFLKKTCKKDELSEIERGGLIKFYEMTFELSWKMLKDYLEEQGFLLNSPKEVLKQSFQIGIIDSADIWIKALLSRNLTTHIYDETQCLD